MDITDFILLKSWFRKIKSFNVFWIVKINLMDISIFIHILCNWFIEMNLLILLRTFNYFIRQIIVIWLNRFSQIICLLLLWCRWNLFSFLINLIWLFPKVHVFKAWFIFFFTIFGRLGIKHSSPVTSCPLIYKIWTEISHSNGIWRNIFSSFDDIFLWRNVIVNIVFFTL